MKLFALLAVIALAEAKVVSNRNCDGVIINFINHEKEVLKTKVDSPYQLAIDYDTNTLFFSYSANTDEIFKSAYISLKDNEFGIISGIEGGFANAVDDSNHIVYLGGREGIYKFNFNTKRALDLGITNENIWQLFYKNGLYFTSYPREEVFVYKGGKVTRVPELIDTKATLVAIDNNENIFFVNSTGLFSYRRTSDKIIFIGEYGANAITSDLNGNIYFSTSDGLYLIDDKQRVVKRLAEFDGEVYGMAVEGDGNIIYASLDSVIRLKPTGHRCFAETAATGYVGDNAV